MLQMFLSVSVVPLLDYLTVHINPLRTSPSHSATECHSFLVLIFFWSACALTGEGKGAEKSFISLGSEPTVGGPGRILCRRWLIPLAVNL